MRHSASARVKGILDFQFFRDFLKQFFNISSTLVRIDSGKFFFVSDKFFSSIKYHPKVKIKKNPKSILTYILLTLLLEFQPDGDCGIKGKIRVAEIIGGLLVNFIISIGQVVHVIIG